jgi:chromate transporter
MEADPTISSDPELHSPNDPPMHQGSSVFRNASKVFLIFLRLGCWSFGGPMAHLAIFHRELVIRRNWMSSEQYTRLMAMCQSLPGPGSSQQAFCIGLHRCGWLGGFAAISGFAFPSATWLTIFALWQPPASAWWWEKIQRSLLWFAMAVVLTGFRSMAQANCKTLFLRSLAISAMIAQLAMPYPAIQLLSLLVCALLAAGWLPVSKTPRSEDASIRAPRGAWLCLPVFLILLLFSTWETNQRASVAGRLTQLFRDTYVAGALVFGGGHVVLPLLEARRTAAGGIDHATFFAGYGAAQAIPGPMFTFGAFLGAHAASEPWRITGAIIGLVGLFLPGLLLAAGMLPFWSRLSGRRWFHSASLGINAAVVGLLAATCIRPLGSHAMHHPSDWLVVLAAFSLLESQRCKLPVLLAMLALIGLLIPM